MVVMMMLLVMMMISIVVEFARLSKNSIFYVLLHLIEGKCNYYHYYMSLKDETEFLKGNLSFPMITG